MHQTLIIECKNPEKSQTFVRHTYLKYTPKTLKFSNNYSVVRKTFYIKCENVFVCKFMGGNA